MIYDLNKNYDALPKPPNVHIYWGGSLNDYRAKFNIANSYLFKLVCPKFIIGTYIPH